MFTGNIYYRGDKTAAEDVLREATQLANYSVAKKEYLGVPNFREQFVLSSGATLDVVLGEHATFMTIVGFGGEVVEEVVEEEFEEFPPKALYLVRPIVDYPQVLIRRNAEGDIELEWADNLKAGRFSTQYSEEDQISTESASLDYSGSQWLWHAIDGPNIADRLAGNSVYIWGYELVDTYDPVIQSRCIGAGVLTCTNEAKFFVYAVAIGDVVEFYAHPHFKVEFTEPTTSPLTDVEDWLLFGSIEPDWLSDTTERKTTMCNFSEDGRKATFGVLRPTEEHPNPPPDTPPYWGYNWQQVFDIEFNYDPTDSAKPRIIADGRVLQTCELTTVEDNTAQIEQGVRVDTVKYYGFIGCTGFSRTSWNQHSLYKWVAYGDESVWDETRINETPYISGLSMAPNGTPIKLEYAQPYVVHEVGRNTYNLPSVRSYNGEVYGHVGSFDNIGPCSEHAEPNYATGRSNYLSTTTSRDLYDRINTLVQTTTSTFSIGETTVTTEDSYNSEFVQKKYGPKIYENKPWDYTYDNDCGDAFRALCPTSPDSTYILHREEQKGTGAGIANKNSVEAVPINYSARQKYFLMRNRSTPYKPNVVDADFNWQTEEDNTLKESFYYSLKTSTVDIKLPGLTAYVDNFDTVYDCLTPAGSKDKENGDVGTDYYATRTDAIDDPDFYITADTTGIPSSFIPHGEGYVLFTLNDWYMQSERDGWSGSGPVTGVLLLYDEKNTKIIDILSMYNNLIASTEELTLDEIDPLMLTAQPTYTSNRWNTFMYEAGITGAEVPEPTINFADYPA